MEKGLNQYWTPGKDLEFEEHIKHCRTFAARHLITLLRDTLKYDGRSKEGKRAMAQARLRLATASDKDLTQLAELEVPMEGERPGEIPGEIPGLARASLVASHLGRLKKLQTKIRENGINKEELQCR